MATSPRNLGYRKLFDVQDFSVSTGTAFNEGDLMIFDPNTHLARPIAAASETAYLLGDAQGTSPVTYHSALSNVGIYCGPHTVKLIAADAGAFYRFTPVYFSTDAQHFAIASGSATLPIGYLNLSPKESGGADSGTTVTGTEYEVVLRRSYHPTMTDNA